MLVEWPVTTPTLLDGVVVVSINVEFNSIWLPVGSIGVEVVLETTGDGSAGMVNTNRVGRSVHSVGIFTNVLHDVNFSASGPSDIADVFTEHPECRPHSLSSGELCSHFEFTVEGSEVTSSSQFTGCVLVSTVLFLSCGDNKVSAINSNILLSISVVLEFIVTEATVGNIDVPLVSVNGVSIEFIAPGLDPAGFSYGGSSKAEKCECGFHNL